MLVCMGGRAPVIDLLRTCVWQRVERNDFALVSASWELEVLGFVVAVPFNNLRRQSQENGFWRTLFFQEKLASQDPF